jgi:hypothetical protein
MQTDIQTRRRDRYHDLVASRDRRTDVTAWTQARDRYGARIASTSAGLAVVYAKDGEIFLTHTPDPPRRRRAMR